MNRKCLITLCAMTALWIHPASAAAPLVFHVATNGNDRWSGGLAAPNRTQTDGPLASLEGARDSIRRLRREHRQSASSIEVLVHGGAYRLTNTFVLSPEDSGLSNAPIVYTAFKNDRPVFSGARVLSGFQKSGTLWQVTLEEVKEGRWHFRELFVNGRRRQRARSPNEGYFHIAGLVPGPMDPASKRPVARDRFVFNSADLRRFERLNDVELTLMHSWETSIHPLKAIDAASNLVVFTAPLKEWWSIGYWEKTQRYFIENAFEALDQPGEWYLNRETGVLSYWPLPGEQITSTEMVVPVLTEFLHFAGNADSNLLVQHITVRGLTFHHADWRLDPRGSSSTQAAVEVPATITADGAEDCAVEGCEVAHTGTYGIWFRRGCKACRIQHNRLFDLGAGGIRVGEDKMAKTDAAETSRTLVDNNHIFDGGRVYPAGIGIWVAQSSHNRISHNDIHDMLYSGLSIGWNWDDATNRTHHNVIEFNHVHHLGKGVMSDAGCIYCLGVSPGSVIRNNVFHDMWPYSKPALGWGIYFDATCGGYLCESNVVFNTRSGGVFWNNGGHDHVIRNNIFALPADYGVWPYWEKRGVAFERNIVYLTQGKLFVTHAENTLQQRRAAGDSPGHWDNNLYWHTGARDQMQFFAHGFSEWQAMGLDQHSMVADPKFSDPEHHDFSLKRGSPALKLGFGQIDASTTGLYGDRAWRNECRHDKCPHAPLPPPPAPPAPLTVNDGFENTPVGAPPSEAVVDGQTEGASIQVTDERAQSGRRSLKITDSATLKPTWQPHFYYEPHLTKGLVRESFDVWLTTNAQFMTEWRDSTGYPKNIGPSIVFDGRGTVSVRGKEVAKLRAEQWIHVSIEMALGKNAKEFQLMLTGEDDTARKLTFPISGTEFHEVHWLGFSSTAAADAVFYLDNLSIEVRR